MNKNKRRWTAGVLAMMMMLLIILAGCGKNDPVNTPANEEEKKTETGETPKDKKKLMFWNLDGNGNADSYGVQAIKDKFDVDIEFVAASREVFNEQLNLKIASGEIPDWWKEPSFSEYDKFLQQEVAAEIPQELIEEHMPKYVAWLKRFLGDDPYKYVRRDGKIYGLPVLWDIGSDGMQLGFREDWLKKVGIAKTPETIEEMEAALTAFRNDDPDGNNKKDTYGITGSAENVAGMFSSVFGAYDAYPDIFREKDGKVVRGEIEPGAKQALEVLNRWYKNELIDPEFVVNKGENVEDKVLTGKTGAIEYYWWAFLPGNAFLGGEQWYDKLKAKNPEFNWAIVGGVKGPEGKYGMSQYHPSYASGVMFSKELNNDREKLIKYLQVFEASQFDPEIYEKLNFGEKDKTWKLSDKGTVEFIAPYTDEKERQRAGIGVYSMAGSFNDYDFQTSYTSDESLRQLAKDTRAKGTPNIDILAPLNKPVYNEYQDKLKQFTLQNYVDFITGRKSLNEFDAFVNDWKKMGGDKVLEEAQKIYDENLK
ncbi:extracellular solute-binding protein [Paenibacillus mendelii]|uniref:Extracellular solute-binding protein n=1 Tax=Paenibacillus mendelii TaxID=206163 RepID=A0ABV6JKG9_9BACL|nr:extracellular solute-binding protein [Paenibacillus mendelii]MCQ6563074.1 extracellular solute-binding protein [Paenibacillus mendelii]